MPSLRTVARKGGNGVPEDHMLLSVGFPSLTRSCSRKPQASLCRAPQSMEKDKTMTAAFQFGKWVATVVWTVSVASRALERLPQTPCTPGSLWQLWVSEGKACTPQKGCGPGNDVAPFPPFFTSGFRPLCMSHLFCSPR